MSKEQNKFGRLIDEATKTPRTQAAIKTYGDYIRSEDAVSIEFAEQLETELAEARAEVERKDKLIEQMREVLELTHADFKDVCKSCMFNNSYPDGHFCSKCPTKLAVARLGAALEAAERGE